MTEAKILQAVAAIIEGILPVLPTQTPILVKYGLTLANTLLQGYVKGTQDPRTFGATLLPPEPYTAPKMVEFMQEQLKGREKGGKAR